MRAREAKISIKESLEEDLNLVGVEAQKMKVSLLRKTGVCERASDSEQGWKPTPKQKSENPVLKKIFVMKTDTCSAKFL